MHFNNNEDSESVDKVKELLESKFNILLNRTKSFSLFDLRSNKSKTIVEVKKRNNTKDKYPTTMVGENKFIKAKEYFERGFDIYFCFQFIDGVYYYKYCDEKLEIRKGGRCDRGRPEIKNYVFIDINKLCRL